LSSKPKLIYAIALPLVIYIVITAIWLLSNWSALESTQALSIARHLGVLLLIVGALFYQPRMGSWFVLAWCAFVPFERYVVLFREISSVLSGAPWSVTGIDIFRILLLLTAGLLAGVLVYNLHFRRKTVVSAQADA
jgi:hypothetical protein